MRAMMRKLKLTVNEAETHDDHLPCASSVSKTSQRR